jgi:ABC-type amino acid transport system permease subunit
MKSKPKALGFQLAAGQTVAVPEVVNLHRGMVPPGIVDAVRKNLVSAMEALGLEVVDSGAEYTLAAALVDLKQDSTYAFVAMVKPFVELEVRLIGRDGEVLARIRDQSHGDNADVASFNFAEELVNFLR